MSRIGRIPTDSTARRRRKPPLAWRFAVWTLCLMLLPGCGLLDRTDSRPDAPAETAAAGSPTPAAAVPPTAVGGTTAPQTLPTGGLGIADSIFWSAASRGIAVAAESGLALVEPAPGGTLQPDLQPQTLTTLQPQHAAAGAPMMLSGAQNAGVLGWVIGEKAVYSLDVTSGDATVLQAESDAPVTGLALSPDGSRITYATFDGQLTVEMVGGQPGAQEVQTFDVPGWLTSLSYSPDGQSVGGVNPPNFTIYVLDVATGQVQRRLEWLDSPTASLYFAIFSPDWSRVAWVAQTAVQVMDAASGASGPLLNHEDHVSAAAWSPDGLRLATAAAATVEGSLVPAVLVWDAQSGDLLTTLSQAAAVKSLAFSPDGGQVAVLDSSGGLQVWNLEQ